MRLDQEVNCFFCFKGSRAERKNTFNDLMAGRNLAPSDLGPIGTEPGLQADMFAPHTFTISATTVCTHVTVVFHPDERTCLLHQAEQAPIHHLRPNPHTAGKFRQTTNPSGPQSHVCPSTLLLPTRGPECRGLPCLEGPLPSSPKELLLHAHCPLYCRGLRDLRAPGSCDLRFFV